MVMVSAQTDIRRLLERGNSTARLRKSSVRTTFFDPNASLHDTPSPISSLSFLCLPLIWSEGLISFAPVYRKYA
jgi:hypothetical protein